MGRNLIKRIARHGLEVVVGGFIGYEIADNFIHPDFQAVDNITSAIMNYGKQMEYNAVGAVVGAAAVPIICLVYKILRNK